MARIVVFTPDNESQPVSMSASSAPHPANQSAPFVHYKQYNRLDERSSALSDFYTFGMTALRYDVSSDKKIS